MTPSMPAEPYSPDSAAGAFELRWMQRNGLLPPPAAPVEPTVESRVEADPAGYQGVTAPNPRRGSLRLPEGGGPQTRMDGPEFQQGPPAPELQGPPAPDRHGLSLTMMAANPLLAIQQGVVQGALENAPTAPPEVQRLLEESTDDTENADRDLSVGGRMREAAATAQKLGIEIAFRMGSQGIEAVQRTPEMAPPGGRVGGLAYAVGTLLGMGFVDPLAGAAAVGARGGGQAIATAGSGGKK